MLSAVIITYNEEKNIERCLESIKDIVAEIVVLDSFSTDKTEEICKSYNVRFEQHVFDDFVNQKNRADQLAQNDYILSLDADEVLSPELRDSIVKVLGNNPDVGYTMNRLTNYCGKWIKTCGWYPDKKLRLYLKDKAKWTGTKIHEKIAITDGDIQHLGGDLLHYSYHSIADHLNQINKFTRLAAEQRKLKGKNVSILKILFHPFFTFIKKYFIKKGITDGYYGFVISVLSAYGSFLKDIQLRQLWQNEQNK